MGELAQFAAEQQQHHDVVTSPEERRARGHFGTPTAIAEFMAGLFSPVRDKEVKILDPGAGVGTLSAAVCQRFLTNNTAKSLYFELWENDRKLIPVLERTMLRCQQAMRATGHEMTFTIKVDDFILANAQHSLFSEGPDPTFHLSILNPPYFKLRKECPQARALSHLVHGQPNIYALFMAVVAELLLPDGEMVAITPRSYFNGPYFRRFRKWFFDRVTVRQIHIFDSRTEAFKDDSVLQENVILHAAKNEDPKDVILTNSLGRDLTEMDRRLVPYTKVIDNSSGDHVVRITTRQSDHEIVDALDDLPDRLNSLDLEISTGPVVTFRSTEVLRYERSSDTAPLLWMHNVRPFITQFPSKNGKPAHIQVCASSKKLLVPSKTYVLLKRFTSKEEKRRIVAGIMSPTDSYSEWVGLENHVNYIHRKGGDITDDEAYGLAAYFNSALVDRYFRAISGNTQVNATEIRNMPTPDNQTLRRIGLETKKLLTKDPVTVERLLGNALQIPQEIIEDLIKAMA